jgi:hypothetical protein
MLEIKVADKVMMETRIFHRKLGGCPHFDCIRKEFVISRSFDQKNHCMCAVIFEVICHGGKHLEIEEIYLSLNLLM